MAITLNIKVEDLSFLFTAKMEWNKEWATQSQRFECVKGTAIDYRLTNAYWLPDWISVMIFRAYLESINATFQILMDNADGIDPYVVTCGEDF
jgi:hypothetical protein